MSVGRLHLERIAVPAHHDELERATWARVRWPIAAGSATHVRTSVGEADSIAVPTYPIAAWIVENWWSLLYELAPSANSGGEAGELSLGRLPDSWRSRHCLRLADSSLLLPDLRVYSAGPTVTWELRADAARWPGQGPALQFLDELATSSPRDQAASVLGDVVGWTLAQLQNCSRDDAARLRERWSFIATAAARAPDAEFCRAAGRMGLDPHDVESWPSGVCQWLEAAPPGTLDQAFSVDLQAFYSDVDDLPGLDRALRELTVRHRLAGKQPNIATDASTQPAPADPEWQIGYDRAMRLRHDAKLAADARVDDLAEPLFSATGVVLLSTDDLQTRAPVSALVGWVDGGVRLVARKSLAGRRTSERFALARGVHHALWACADGPRLVSDAADKDQRASRAFAAELLAPRAAVMRSVQKLRREMPFEDALVEVAAHFEVEDLLVRWQYRNAVEGR